MTSCSAIHAAADFGYGRACMEQAQIEILDPSAPPPLGGAQPTARLSSIAGKVLGIRRDSVWQSFTVFTDAIAQIARDSWKVRDVVFFDPGIRVGTTEEERRKVAGFARGVDLAIVGLGT